LITSKTLQQLKGVIMKKNTIKRLNLVFLRGLTALFVITAFMILQQNMVRANEQQTVTIEGHTYIVTPGTETSTTLENFIWNQENYNFNHTVTPENYPYYNTNGWEYNVINYASYKPRVKIGWAEYDEKSAVAVGTIDLDHLYELEKQGYTIVSRVHYALFYGSGTLRQTDASIHMGYAFPYFRNQGFAGAGGRYIYDGDRQWADVYLGSEYNGYDEHTYYYIDDKYYLWGDTSGTETHPTLSQLGGLMESVLHKKSDFIYQDPSYDSFVYNGNFNEATNTPYQDLQAAGYNRYGLKEDHVLFQGDRDTLEIWAPGGKGNLAFIYTDECWMEFAIFDNRSKVSPIIESATYSINGTALVSDPANWKKLSYSGPYNSVRLDIKFDRPIIYNEANIAEAFIPTNMSLKDNNGNYTAEGSFTFSGYNNSNNTMTFMYNVNYGAWGREGEREGLGNNTQLKLAIQNGIIDFFINKMEIKSLDQNEPMKTRAEEYNSDYAYHMRWHNVWDHGDPLTWANVTVDGDPPEIASVEYEIIAGDTKPFLNVGDVFEIRVVMADLPDGERIYVNSNGYFPFTSGASAPIYDWQSGGYGNGDIIKYRYTVGPGFDTNNLKHEIIGSPPTSQDSTDNTYENQVYNQALKMGIRDDYGNVALMLKAGANRFATLLFPAVQDEFGRQIYIDTTAPLVNFDNRSFMTYKNEQIFDLTPVERGSMLENGVFYYVISKDPNHPTEQSGTSLENHLGAFTYPYTRSGSDMWSGYSDISGFRNVTINNDLYLGVDGYTNYDARYNPVTKEVVYENVDYVLGTSTDVVYNERREITGTFYIHTYLKDMAGNVSFQTSQPIQLDNTTINSLVYPNGTNKYVGYISIFFEVVDAAPSTYSHYEYRWLTPLDRINKTIDPKDRYTSDTDTFDLLRDASGDWVTGDVLNAYNKSYIPIPEFASRQHGAHYLLIRGYDNAGNVEYIVSEPYYFDKQSPEVTFTSISGSFNDGLLNHQVQVAVEDEHTDCVVYKYYFSQSILTRDLNDPIWVELPLELPDMPEDYDPLSDVVDPSLLVRSAILNTNDWNTVLNGYVFLHVHAKDAAGNLTTVVQEMIVDRGGIPWIGFRYDQAIDNRYSQVIGKAQITDDGGVDTVEYAFSQSDESVSEYQEYDMSQVVNSRDFIFETPVFSEEGTWYLHLRVVDVFGNVVTRVSEAYTINSNALSVSDFSVSPLTTIVTNESIATIQIVKAFDDNLEYHYKLYSDLAHQNLIKETISTSVTNWINIPLDTSATELQRFYLVIENDLGTPANQDIVIEAVYDSTPPSATLEYSPDASDGTTGSDVTVSLKGLSDNYTTTDNLIVNSMSYIFTQNGTYTFIIEDEAGNVATYIATVDYIAHDRPIVFVDGHQKPEESNNEIKLELTAKRPTEGGYIAIDAPVINYQWVLEGDSLSEEDWVAYNNGETLLFNDENLGEGRQQLFTRLTDYGRNIVQNQGTYIMDYTVSESSLLYEFNYRESEGEQEQTFNGNQEAYDAFDFEGIFEITSSISVNITWNEPEVSVISLEKDGTQILPASSVAFDFNGTATFTYADSAGNEGIAVVTIETLTDKVVSATDATVTLSTEEWTNEPVQVTITAPANQILGNITADGENKDAYLTDGDTIATFSVSANVTIEWGLYTAGVPKDSHSLIKTETIDVTNIDIVLPVGTITTETVDDHATAATLTITDNLPTSVLSVTFTNSETITYTFTVGLNEKIGSVIYNGESHKITAYESGILTYTFKDLAGNQNTVSEVITFGDTSLDMSKVTVSYIVDGISYATTGDIGVTGLPVNVQLSLPPEYKVVNNNGNLSRVFYVGMLYDFLVSNGYSIDKFSIDLTDVIVTDEPGVNITYTIEGQAYNEQLINGKTGKDVLMTLTSSDGYAISETIINGISDTAAPFSYLFTENGQIQVKVINEIGNEKTMTMTMDFINKEPVRAGLFSLNRHVTNDAAIELRFMATKPVK
jgi:hypothetical protein